MKHIIQEKMVGIQAIIITPFKENGDVDYRTLEKQVERLMEIGVRWFTCTGNTGEFSSLALNEYKEVIKTVRNVTSETDSILVPGIGSSSLKSIIDLCNAAELMKVDAIMVPPPYHNVCSYEGAYAFFEKLMEFTKLPMQFYYYPELHRMYLSVEQLCEILSLPGFVAIKETSNSIPTHVSLTGRISEEINVISGSGEFHMPDAILGGAKGFISTIINYSPTIPIKLWEATNNKNYEKVVKMRNLLNPLFELIETNFSVSLLKQIMNEKGLQGGSVRLPIIEAKHKEDIVKKFIETIDEIESHELYQ